VAICSMGVNNCTAGHTQHSHTHTPPVFCDSSESSVLQKKFDNILLMESKSISENAINYQLILIMLIRKSFLQHFPN